MFEQPQLPERRNSLPTLGRGFKGVRRSTPLLTEDEILRSFANDCVAQDDVSAVI
jgi:hypothetical protein